MNKKFKCPFCGKRTIRDSRALLEEKFCRHCIDQRIVASGGQQYSADAKLVEVTKGYFVIK